MEHAFVPGLLGLSLATALVGGVFLTFSDFVMRSLGAAVPVAGIESMQLINRKVYRSVFMGLLLGIVPVAGAMAAYAAVYLGMQVAFWLAAGTLAYVFGVMGVTIAGNVPMNKRLDVMTASAPETFSYWSNYLKGWTAWNHIRVIASIASAFLFAMAAVKLAQTL